MIERHRGQYSVRRMCRVLGVSPSGYYAWSSRPESDRAREDRRLKVLIREIFKQSRRNYGSPRIAEELRARGECCGRNRVARLMREEGLVGRRPRRYRSLTDSNHRWPVAPNRLNQEFAVKTPDTVWLGDLEPGARQQDCRHRAHRPQAENRDVAVFGAQARLPPKHSSSTS